jgi:CDP-diacylglycerol--serine O-phosphatidyltransferase
MTPIKRLSAADLMTLSNALLGFLAITYVVDGRYAVASLLVFIAILLDGLDGALARKFGTTHQFGRYLDFFADSVSFCFAPATLIYSVTYDISRGPAWVSWENALAVVLPTFYVTMGLLRLARFAEEGYRKPYFEGLPTPAAAYLLITVYVLLGGESPMGLASQISVLMVAGFAGFAMMTSLHYPKLQGNLLVPSLAGVLLMVAATGLVVTNYGTLSVSLNLICLVMIALYVILGPVYSGKSGTSGALKGMD